MKEPVATALPTWRTDFPEEYRFGMDGTAWKLFACSVHLFAEYDYSSISMRRIADEVGIRASSIYNHFSSKEALLDRMYDYTQHYFFTTQPPLEKFLAMAETAPPRQVLYETHFYYPQPLQSIMSKLILICSKLMRTDAHADALLKAMLIDSPKRYGTAILQRMLELGRIQPLDVDAYVELYTNNYYGASLRMYSSHPVNDELWKRSFILLCDLVVPTGE